MKFERHRFAFALLALIALTLFLPALLKREVFTLRDHFDYFQPLRAFTADELSAGRLPLWNPYSASGEPWLANPQTGVFYPPAWLFLALPFETAYMLYLLLHLILLGWGAYLLFARFIPLSPLGGERAGVRGESRDPADASAAAPHPNPLPAQRGEGTGAAMVGAAALMFSGPVLSLLDVSNNFATLAWIPLVLWCALEGAWKRGAIVLALAFLGGEPFFAAIAALMYAVVRRHRDVFLTALLAFGLSAVQLIPFLEFVANSDRAGGMEDTLILRDSMHLRDWLQTILPSAPSQQQFIPVLYIGVIVIALALVGIATRTRAVAGWLALLIAAIAISTGPAWLTQMPVTLFRYPARLVPFVALAIAALAAIGWQRLRGERRWVDLLVMLVIVADLLLRATPLLATAPFRRDVVPYDKAIGATGKVLRFGDVDVHERAEWMSGYLNLYDRRFDAFTAAPLTSAKYLAMYRKLMQAPTFESFAYAGVVFILTKNELPKTWYHVTSAGNVHVFRNPQAFPMAAHFAHGSVSLRRGEWKVDTSSARVTINAPSDGIVVLRQQAAPGWRVSVDGKPASPLVIDGIFRGVNVAKGHHEIVWKYRPPSLFIGAAVTIITLFTMQIFLFVKHRKRRSSMKIFSSGPSNLE